MQAKAKVLALVHNFSELAGGGWEGIVQVKLGNILQTAGFLRRSLVEGHNLSLLRIDLQLRPLGPSLRKIDHGLQLEGIGGA